MVNPFGDCAITEKRCRQINLIDALESPSLLLVIKIKKQYGTVSFMGNELTDNSV
jgi:hypothetical protein